jgi:hypothetical protein
VLLTYSHAVEFVLFCYDLLQSRKIDVFVILTEQKSTFKVIGVFINSADCITLTNVNRTMKILRGAVVNLAQTLYEGE